MHVIRRGFGTLARVLGVLVLGLVVALALIALRLSSGPLPLDAIAPLIASALSADDGSFVAHIGHAELELADRGASIEVLAHAIRIDNRTGALLAGVPELTLGFDMSALLHGTLAPTRIVISEPRLHLVRDTAGAFDVGIGEEGQSGTGIVARLLEDLIGPPDSRRILASLREIALRDASLLVEDRMLGTEWRTRRAAATIRRVPGGFAGDASLAVEIDDSTAEMQARLGYDEAARRADFRMDIAGWEMAKLTRIAPALRPLAALHAPVDGSLQFAVHVGDWRIEGARADLTAGAGSLDRPELSGGRVAISGGQFRARYDPETARLILEKLALDFGGPAATIKGTIDGIDPDSLLKGALPANGEFAVDGKVEIDAMPADALAQYWPPDLASNAREWVTTNIRDGVVDEADLATKFRLRSPDLAITSLDAFGGSLRMHGLTVTYRAPLPPVTGVDGSATFDQTHMVLQPTSGTLKGLRVGGGTVVITDLDKHDQDIDIALDVAGPLRDALEVLDSEPFGYAHEIGLDPARVAGHADAHLSFKFPLDHRTTFDDVVLAAQARLTGVALGKILFDHDLSDGNLALRLDRDTMRIDGTARLAELPASLSWQENFKPVGGVRSHYAVKTRVDEAAMRRLGLDLGPELRLSGAADLSATMTNFAAKVAPAGARKPPPPRSEAVLRLDLKDAGIAIPDLDWSKPVGGHATAAAQLELAGDRLRAVRQASLLGSGIDLRLSAGFAGDEALQRLDVSHLLVGRTNLSGNLTRRPQGGWRAELTGGSLDATHILDGLTKPDKAQWPPLQLDAKLQRVILGAGREARNVALQFESDARHWQRIDLDLVPFGAGSLSLRYGESKGERPFSLTASDLGAVLRLFDISNHVSGGTLRASGEAQDAGGARILTGHFEGDSYKVTGAPVLAKLLALASFSGIASLLQGEGIPFSHLSGDFSLQDGIVTLRQGRTYGGAMGINADGIIDIDKNAVDLAGTVVPAYTLNSILGNIPLIGNLLQGGEGQGLFAASYHVKGPLDTPSVTVNPLTALAPGFLRNLFLSWPSLPGTLPEAGGNNSK